MLWKVEFTETADKQLSSLDKPERERINFADAYIQAVKADGLDDEIAIVSRCYRLAHALGPIRRRVLRKAW